MLTRFIRARLSGPWATGFSVVVALLLVWRFGATTLPTLADAHVALPWRVMAIAGIVYVLASRILDLFTPPERASPGGGRARLVNAALIGGGMVLAAGLVRHPWLDVRYVPDDPELLWAGAILVLAGLGFALYAKGWQFLRLRRQAEPTFVADGPFAWVRHPAAAGILVALMAVALIHGTVAGLVGAFLVAWAFKRRVAAHDAAQAERFGDAYVSYATGRAALVPGVL